MTVSSGIKRLLWFWILLMFASVVMAQEAETIDVSAWDMHPIVIRAESMFVMQRIDPATGEMAYVGFYFSPSSKKAQAAYVYTKKGDTCYHGTRTIKGGKSVFTKVPIACKAFGDIDKAFNDLTKQDLLSI